MPGGSSRSISLSAAASARDTVRAGLEKAFEDLRKALLESKNKLA
jgi:hypothetical protein